MITFLFICFCLAFFIGVPINVISHKLNDKKIVKVIKVKDGFTGSLFSVTYNNGKRKTLQIAYNDKNYCNFLDMSKGGKNEF